MRMSDRKSVQALIEEAGLAEAVTALLAFRVSGKTGNVVVSMAPRKAPLVTVEDYSNMNRATRRMREEWERAKEMAIERLRAACDASIRASDLVRGDACDACRAKWRAEQAEMAAHIEIEFAVEAE